LGADGKLGSSVHWELFEGCHQSSVQHRKRTQHTHTWHAQHITNKSDTPRSTRILGAVCGIFFGAAYVGVLGVLAAPLNCQFLESDPAKRQTNYNFPEVGEKFSPESFLPHST
jgi:hypothetical protein